MSRRLLSSFAAALLVALGVLLGPESGSAGGPLGERLGVNEGVSVPRRLIEVQSMGLPEILPLLEQDADALSALGSRWVRLNSVVHPYTNMREFQGFEAMDQWMRVVQARGLEVLVVLSPWSGNGTFRQTERYVVDDEQAWTSWVGAFVERYDGDGVGDMPGLRKGVHHWEVDNEPDLKNDPPGPREDPDFCTVDQYAALLDLTAVAIRGADAQAVVLNGGIYRPHRPQGRAYLEGVLARAPEAVDVVSVHIYPEDIDAFERGVDNALAAAAGRPVWITETSVSSDPGEEQQALMLERMVELAFSKGVEKLFWHTLNDPPVEARRAVGMHGHSLYHHGMVAKPAAEAWTRLALGTP